MGKIPAPLSICKVYLVTIKNESYIYKYNYTEIVLSILEKAYLALKGRHIGRRIY